MYLLEALLRLVETSERRVGVPEILREGRRGADELLLLEEERERLKEQGVG